MFGDDIVEHARDGGLVADVDLVRARLDAERAQFGDGLLGDVALGVVADRDGRSGPRELVRDAAADSAAAAEDHGRSLGESQRQHGDSPFAREVRDPVSRTTLGRT
ncbi:hypothetical protein P9209_01205 [Prescottella defluvii]|nr:hypothetical protein P9209_01205 [Prescottella defluvii]